MSTFIDAIKEANIAGFLLLSSIHEDAHLRTLADAYKTRLESLGVKRTAIVRTENDAKRALQDLRTVDGIIMVFLSGGTSKLAQSIYTATRIPPLLVSHEYHNASASMMSAQSRIRFELGGRVAGWVVASPTSTRLSRALTAYRAAASLKRLHIVQLDSDKPSSDTMVFQEKIGGRVTLVGREETDKLLEEASKDVEKLAAELTNIDLGGVNNEQLRKTLRVLAAALKAIKKFDANAFTVDCFPFILRHRVTPCLAMSWLLDHGYVAACEADYRALTLLALSFGLSGLPGWIANFNALLNGRELRLSHCTVATRLTRYVTLLPHFETGNPYAVAGQIRDGEYTILALSPDYTVLWYVEGSLRTSGTLVGGKCRTQAIIDLIEGVNEAGIVSNHHVLVPGRHGEWLHVIAGYYGMRLTKGGGDTWY